MDEIIKDYLSYCCHRENQFEGITAFVYSKTDVKKLEAKAEDHYKHLRVADFIITMNNIRGEWGDALNKFTQVEMGI